MRPNYNFGDEVRLIRNVRNDGTYPGMDIGKPLVSCGSTGHVQSVGTYLQDYIIYGVHFLESDILVGCREEELISIDDKWVPSKYEFRDKVRSHISLGIKGEIIVEKGTQGEIEKVLRNAPGGVQYHVRFPGRSLQVPETALEDLSE